MSEARWVQHISGQGEKWEVATDARLAGEDHELWIVYKHPGTERTYYLPKSEYVLCAPPEQWVDVTEVCETDEYSNTVGDFFSIIYTPTGANVLSKRNPGYRIRKVQRCKQAPSLLPVWVFLIEKKETT